VSYKRGPMTEDQVPASWYPDPDQQGQLRYWDGSAWTDDRKPASVGVTVTEVAPPSESSLVTAAGADADAAAAAPLTTQRLASEDIVVAAPMSFAGSAERIWKLTRTSDDTATKVALYAVAIIGVGLAWVLVLFWYLIFGLLLVPYRLIRRGSRKRKLAAAQHRELLSAVDRSGSGQSG
jgi:hypothetical protein